MNVPLIQWVKCELICWFCSTTSVILTYLARVTNWTDPAINIFPQVPDSKRRPLWDKTNQRIKTRFGRNWRRITVHPQTMSPFLIWPIPTWVSPMMISYTYSSRNKIFVYLIYSIFIYMLWILLYISEKDE